MTPKHGGLVIDSTSCAPPNPTLWFFVTTPLSIVIPVRNRRDLLARCLDSLVSQHYDLSNCEVLVCDDGSTEDLSPVVRNVADRLDIRLLHQPPKGPAAARNMGILAASAELVVFLDSDVEAESSFLSEISRAAVEHPLWLGIEARLVPSGSDTGPLSEAPHTQDGGRYHTAGIAYRRSTLLQVEGFDESFRLAACEDVEIAMRVLQFGQIGFADKAVVRHPRRLVTLTSRWSQRRHWRYVAILATRYGVLGFPDRNAGPLPRLRVALSATTTLPFGRFLQGIRHLPNDPGDGVKAMLYALSDVAIGFSAVPGVLLSATPARTGLDRHSCE